MTALEEMMVNAHKLLGFVSVPTVSQ